MGMLISEIQRRWPPGATPDLTMADLQQLYPEAAAACTADADRMAEARIDTARGGVASKAQKQVRLEVRPPRPQGPAPRHPAPSRAADLWPTPPQSS